MTEHPLVDKIAKLFHERGSSLYGGEAVTQEEHALQAAMLAEENGDDAAGITAALLHDVGHLLHDLPSDAPDSGVDDVHEKLAYEWLSKYFGPDVCEPVRLHVAAKRYLCAVDLEYHDSLSEPSRQSLALQGGPFNEAEIQEFESHPYFEQSIRLRHWDDLAKIADLPTADLPHFLTYVAQMLRSSSKIEALS
ncbi:MAG: HD domain-containing protein [Bythopirellula sp.]|nr:HD domain-containing protein [Bythopirellula sp.]